MLSKIFLASAVGSLLAGHYYFLEHNKLVKLFNQLEDIPSIDFDYTQSLDDIPSNGVVSICAEVDQEKSKLRAALHNKTKQVIFSDVVTMLPQDKKVTKAAIQNENEAFDEFYVDVPNKSLPKFYLRNLRQEKIEIVWPSDNNIGFFNVKALNDNVDATKVTRSGSITEKLQRIFNSKLKYGEVGIDSEEKLMYVGEISRVKGTDIKDGVHFKLKPRYVLGESKDFFMRYVDGQIMKHRKRAIYLLVTAVTFGGVRLGVRYYERKL
jgi:hypothetical protein